MSENVFLQPETAQSDGQLQIAKIGSGSSSLGWTLILDGQTTATTKRYKTLTSISVSVSAGDRVLVAKISGTYLIVGKLY